MSTMYNRSLVMFEQSKNALGKIANDDAYLDVACFEAQQAIEFLMKAILMEYGIPYNRTHDIRYLLNLLIRNQTVQRVHFFPALLFLLLTNVKVQYCQYIKKPNPTTTWNSVLFLILWMHISLYKFICTT